jgi:exodeoxyribonuclease-3
MAKLKIASWNINSVRARIDIVRQFLEEQQIDILCLQETKVRDDTFPFGMFRDLGYDHFEINGQPMHHGVAIISKLPLHDHGRHDWQDNGEARHVGVRLDCGIRLENVYVPAGGDIADREVNPKFGQKLDFLGRMIRWSEELREPTLLVGDFNIAPLECDVYDHKALLKVVSHTPIEVETLGRFQQAHAWVDLGRRFIPAPERNYSWWSYRSYWRQKDQGRRLDHMWASPQLAPHAVGHRFVEETRRWDQPSDHVPLVTEFAL